jgi:hypothetical protein
MTEKMGLWGAVAIAVGTMIGASIFSVFGLGARIAGHNLPLVFVLLMRYEWQTDRTAFYATWATLAGSVLLETVYRLATHRALIRRTGVVAD